MMQKSPNNDETLMSTQKVDSPALQIPNPAGTQSNIMKDMTYDKMETSKEPPINLVGSSHILTMSGLDEGMAIGKSHDALISPDISSMDNLASNNMSQKLESREIELNQNIEQQKTSSELPDDGSLLNQSQVVNIK